MSLRLEQVSCGYGRKAVLSRVTLTVNAGDFLCVLGPNGSGKSALLKTIVGLLPTGSGRIFWEEREWHTLSMVAKAKAVAFVPQAHAPVFAFSVRDVVVMGRTAYWPLWSGPTLRDWEIADGALEALGLGGFAQRIYSEISGGERQLVLVARALAQEAKLLVLDEPASSLDFGNQARVLQAVEKLARAGTSILMATHQPDHVLRFANRVALLHNGRMSESGVPAEVITSERLEEVYHVPFLISEVENRTGGRLKVCVPAP